MQSVRTVVGRACVTAAMLVAAAAAADAQQQPQPPPPPSSLFVEDRAWNVTPFIGVAFGGNLETTPALGGASIGWNGRGLGFEGEISRLHAEQGVPTPFEFTTWTFMLNGIYGFDSEYNFTPYGLFGVGFQTVDADLSGIVTPPSIEDSATEFAWNVGVGLNTWLTDRAGLRADLRYLNGSDLSPNFWRVYGGFSWRFRGNN